MMMLICRSSSCVNTPPTFLVQTASVICHASVMGNNGQVCCAGTRNYVHADIYDEFVAKAVECAKNRKVGDPWTSGIANGALVSLLLLCNTKAGYTLCNMW